MSARAAARMREAFRGTRVELSPGLDLWVRGARFGTIQRIEPVSQIATVRVDNVRKLQRIRLTDLSARVARLIGPPSETHVLTGTRVYFLDLTLEGRMKVTPEPMPQPTRVFWVDPDALESESRIRGIGKTRGESS